MLTLRRQPVPFSFLAATLLIGVIGLRAFTLPEEQSDQGSWVVHTHQVLRQLETLSLHLSQAENNQRGFLLSGADDNLEQFSQDVTRLSADVEEFRRLTLDNPHQQAQIPLLQQRLGAQIAGLKDMIDKHPEGIAAARKPPVVTNEADMKLLDQQIELMRSEEFHLLSERMDRWRVSTWNTSWIFVGSVAALYLLICIVYRVMSNESRYRTRLLEAEREETDRLLQIVGIQREVAINRLNLQSAMQSICNRTQSLTGADGALVEMLEGEDMVYRAASGTATPHIGLRLRAETSLSGLCVAENRVMICADSETDSRVDRVACQRVGLRSMVVVPLRHDGQGIGVLKVLSSRVNAFTDQHIVTLELLASTLSSTISDALAADELHTANEQLQQVNTELAYQKLDLENANTRLESLATTDGLTGLKNHRTFQEKLAEEYLRASRHKTELSLIMLDVDHFKTFNDAFGHPAGDAVLKRVATLLQEAARATDCLARYGGEEFALLLPETGAQGAFKTAERIRQMISEAAWKDRPISVSVGVGTLSASMESAAQLLKTADAALYQSKRDGRNRTTHAQDSD